MTKSTITRERIQRIIRAIDSEAYDEEEIREWLSSDEIMELARMALSAMDSEPEYLPLDYLQGQKDGLEWAAQLAEANHPETGDWLYDDPIELSKAIRKGPDMPPSQPAPVVPEEATPDSIEILASGRCRDHVVYQWDEDQRNAAADSWNACRAAMLEADPQLPGSDSAPVPGSWIPVSERMPENDGAYLCWDNRYVTTYAFIFGAWQANQFIAKNITHWMPLPAGPQGVKGE